MKQDQDCYQIRVVLTAIICAWIALVACLVFKLFGSKVFDIAITNQRFLDVCYWLDNSGLWCKFILQILMYLVSNTFFILASSMKPNLKTKWLFIIIPTLCCLWVIKFFNSIAGFVLEIVAFITIPAIMSKKWWYGFVGVALNLLFQILSMFIRGQEMKIFDSNTILSLVLSIDYYIMIALFYLYAIVIYRNKNKEV